MSKGRAIAATCLVFALGGALDAPVARAGTYEVAICHDPVSQWTAPTDGISFPTSGAFVDAGVYDRCSASGFLYAALDGLAAHGPSDSAAWEFQAPAGTTIAGAQLYRAFSAAPGSANGAPTDRLTFVSSSGAGSVLATCSQANGCTSMGTGPLSEFDPANALAVGGLSAITTIVGSATCAGGASCPAGSGAVCPELGGPCIASNRLYAMVVTLEDDNAPTASNVSGSLVQPGALAGVAAVSFAATDTGSGLYSAGVTVDGRPLASTRIDANNGRCVPLDAPGSGGPAAVLRFGWTVPCSLAGGGTVELDTRALHDGAHSVVVTVSDAAGNIAVAWSGTIHTDNAPHGGIPQIYGDARQGQTLTASTGSWSPAPAGYAYQWERCDAAGENCAAILGATASAYAVGPADAYHQLAVVVTASDTDGATSATSAPSGPVLDADGYLRRPQGPKLRLGSLPRISGAAQEANTLTAEPGGWSHGPLHYSYTWERCEASGPGCSPIPGALGASYTLVGADDYLRVRVLVNASGPRGTSVAASEPTRVVADASGSSGGGASPLTPRAAHGANGTGACSAARLRATVRGSGSAAVPLGHSVTLRGALDCGTAPISRALVLLEITPAAGAAPVRYAQVHTAADGSFTYLLGPGPSRRITLSYRAFAGDATPSARASAKVLVTPAISLRISPSHTFNGHTIVFSGALSGGHEPRGGLALELEYRAGSRWMVYDVVRARPGDGRFTYQYTFERTTQSITYTFRVVIPPSGVRGYPYQPTTSPARSVHVDP